MFVIRWRTYGYVTNSNSNRKPYSRTPGDPDTKRWRTRANAERFLSLKDPSWAAGCVVEALPES